jgi:hypothetical protein
MDQLGPVWFLFVLLHFWFFSCFLKASDFVHTVVDCDDCARLSLAGTLDS